MKYHSLLKAISAALVAATCTTCPLLSDQGDDFNEREGTHVIVGSRTLSQDDYAEFERIRQLDEEGPSIGKECNLFDGDGWFQFFGHDKYYYPGAYHSVAKVWSNDTHMCIEDDSLWEINYYDRCKVHSWFNGHKLLITTNDQLFSSYKYKIYNKTLGVSVLANLKDGPLFSIATRINMLNYSAGRIYLNDGSVWEVTYFDRDVLNNWIFNDSIIIGIKDSYLNPYVLINADTKTFVRAHLVEGD